MTLKQAIQQLAQTGDEKYAKICEVISVDTQNKTADLQPLDGSSSIDDALLQVDDNGILVEPQIGSLVACVFVSQHKAIIVNHSKLKQFQIQIDQAQLQLDQDGFIFEKNGVSLKKLFNDLLTELKNAVIQTPQGPGNFAPNNVAKFEQIYNQANQLFK